MTTHAYTAEPSAARPTLDFDQLITRLNLTRDVASALRWRSNYERDINALQPPDYSSMLNCFEARRLTLDAAEFRRLSRRVTTVSVRNRGDAARLALRFGQNVELEGRLCNLSDDGVLCAPVEGHADCDSVPLEPVGYGADSERFEQACARLDTALLAALLAGVQQTRLGRLHGPEDGTRYPAIRLADVQGSERFDEILDDLGWHPITRQTRIRARSAFLTGSSVLFLDKALTMPVVLESGGDKFWVLGKGGRSH